MSVLEVVVRDHIAWLTLNRPHVANAIDRGLLRELNEALSAVLQNPEVRCLVLSAAGANFCSGVDLRSLQTGSTASRANIGSMERSFLDHTVARLREMRLPLVAAVNGVAAGAGMTLALTADVILMTPEARFLPSFLRLGLVPDNGITCLLAERVGASRARAVLMLAEPISASTAHQWGLAHEVIGPEELHPRAHAVAKRLAAGPQRTLACTRALFSGPDTLLFGKQVTAERSAHQNALKEGEYLEGLAAFFEHREPRFQASTEEDSAPPAGRKAEM